MQIKSENNKSNPNEIAIYRIQMLESLATVPKHYHAQLKAPRHESL